jgi:hypothetical protein
MALNLKNRPPKAAPEAAPTSAINELVRQAVACRRRLKELERLEGGRLSADALVRETLGLIGSTPARIKQLRSAIEGDTPGLTYSRDTVRSLVRDHLRNGTWRSAPKNEQVLKPLMRKHADPATVGELAAKGYTIGELFCAAVQIAGKQFPDCFGTVEDSQRIEKETIELRTKEDELFRQIEKSFTAQDLIVDGPAPSFRLSDGHVPIAPLDNAGERLVNYLLANKRSI